MKVTLGKYLVKFTVSSNTNKKKIGFLFRPVETQSDETKMKWTITWIYTDKIQHITTKNSLLQVLFLQFLLPMIIYLILNTINVPCTAGSQRTETSGLQSRCYCIRVTVSDHLCWCWAVKSDLNDPGYSPHDISTLPQTIPVIQSWDAPWRMLIGQLK